MRLLKNKMVEDEILNVYIKSSGKKAEKEEDTEMSSEGIPKKIVSRMC